MVCIQVPVFDSSAAEKKSVKSRWCSAASAPAEPPGLLEAAAAVTVGIYRGDPSEQLFDSALI
jgi:hypothetical protein